MSTVVIVPYAPLCVARTLALEWCVERWGFLLPDAQIIVHSDRPKLHGGEPGSFNKPRAVNAGFALAPDDTTVVIVADCDTTTDTSIYDRIELAEKGTWSVPAMYRRLTPEQTDRCLDGWTPSLPETDDQETSRGSWSGVVVLPTAAVEAIGGRFDERFDGWSSDDIALGMALETLYAPVTRLGTVWHLDHPRSIDDTYGRPGFEDARALTERYVAAHGDPEAMREVISGS